MEQALELKPNTADLSGLLAELVEAYDRIGNWGRSEIFHRQIAGLAADPANAKQLAWTVANAHQQLYLAADCALKQGHFDKAISTLQNLISEKQASKKKVEWSNSNTEPAISDCLFLLANGVLDGSSNYREAFSLYENCVHAEEELNKNASPSFRSHNLYRSPEMEVNLFICCSKTGNTERANKLRQKLKQDIRASLSTTTNASQTAGKECLALLEKNSLSRADEIRLMENVPQVIFAGSPKIGESDHLLQRALVIRQNSQPVSTQAVSEDYASLTKLYLSHFESRAAQPYCWLQIQHLKKTSAPTNEIEQAKINWERVNKK